MDLSDVDGLVEALQNADIEDDALFPKLICAGCDVLGITDPTIAHRFGISKPTLARWKSGESLPHPLMRKPVYAWLLARASGHST